MLMEWSSLFFKSSKTISIFIRSLLCTPSLKFSVIAVQLHTEIENRTMALARRLSQKIPGTHSDYKRSLQAIQSLLRSIRQYKVSMIQTFKCMYLYRWEVSILRYVFHQERSLPACIDYKRSLRTIQSLLRSLRHHKVYSIRRLYHGCLIVTYRP